MENTVNVKNRSARTVHYHIEETGVRRTWTPREVKRNIPVAELETALYTPGVESLFEKYLVVSDPEVCDYLGLEVEPEYFYDEKEVKHLLTKGSLEQLLDCLDFAPTGVIQLIKEWAVKTNLNDVRKRDAIKSAIGFDVSAAISNAQYSEEEIAQEDSSPKRRSNPISVNKKSNNTENRKEVPDSQRGRRTETISKNK